MILDTFKHGPLVVYLDSESGAVVQVLDLATGAPAAGLYRLHYIVAAKKAARLAWEATADR
jgi:hypothetical protein